MISRVVGEKVEKKCQALLLPPATLASLPPLPPASGTPGAGLLGMTALPALKPGEGGKQFCEVWQWPAAGCTARASQPSQCGSWGS